MQVLTKMRFDVLKIASAAAVGIGLTTGSAAAAPTITMDQSAFDSATSGLLFHGEDFNGSFPSSLSNPYDFGPFSVSSPAEVQVIDYPSQCVSGGCLYAVQSKDPTITFDAPVYALSFILGDILDFHGGSIMLGINGEPEIAALTSINPLPHGVFQFFGIYDFGTPITSISIRTTDGGDTVGLDNLMWSYESAYVPPPPPSNDPQDPPSSSEIPEPASIALLGAGLLGLGMTRRRKRVA